jgi:hypothetical protein
MRKFKFLAQEIQSTYHFLGAWRRQVDRATLPATWNSSGIFFRYHSKAGSHWSFSATAGEPNRLWFRCRSSEIHRLRHTSASWRATWRATSGASALSPRAVRSNTSLGPSKLPPTPLHPLTAEILHFVEVRFPSQNKSELKAQQGESNSLRYARIHLRN